MERRWWGLPAALIVLVVGACGVAGSTVGDAETTAGSPPPSPLPESAPPGQCPAGGTGRGYAISLASTGVHGADTPEAAANSTEFGLQPDWAFASTTWTTTSAGPQVIWLAQDQGSVEVFRLPDGSWYVTSVTRCD